VTLEAAFVGFISFARATKASGHACEKKVLVRIGGAGGTHELLAWLTRRRLFYSVGFSLPGDLPSIQANLAEVPGTAWEPAYDGTVRAAPVRSSPSSPPFVACRVEFEARDGARTINSRGRISALRRFATVDCVPM
jgi:hypothetical protein